MRFSWTGLLLAPLLAPAMVAAVLAGLIGTSQPFMGFLILLVPGCVICYCTMVFVFLPCLFLVSRCRPMTGFLVCLLGLGLGAAMVVPLTVLEWKSSGPDSGPPDEPLWSFFLRWTADPMTAIEPIAGLITAGLYWKLGTWRQRQAKPALTQDANPPC